MQSERIRQRIERLLAAADEAVGSFDWTAVRENAEAVLRLDPDNPDALTFLAAADRDLSRNQGELATSSPTPGPQTAEPSSFVGGRYQVTRFLGEGGKKRVYLARDTRLDREVAFALLKVDGLDPESHTRLHREAQAMAKLGDHPHVVAVYDIGDEAGQPYLVSQFMAGGSLQDLLARTEEHRLPLRDALQLADHVCQALEHAHSQGIVHRDLKPGNVWLSGGAGDWGLGAAGSSPPTPNPQTPTPIVAKLGDFGLALSLDHSRLTQVGVMVGTLAYMAPEQALGGEVTARSDLYSLGALLYELATGRPPFVGDDSVAIITQHLNTPPVAPSWHRPDLPLGLETLILRLLEKDPAKRPDSASEVRQMLATGGPPSSSAAPQAAASPAEGEGNGALAAMSGARGEASQG